MTDPWKPDPLAWILYEHESTRNDISWPDSWRVFALVVALLLTCIWW